jgi:hypothetical protein
MPTFKPYTAELSMAEYYDDEELRARIHISPLPR